MPLPLGPYKMMFRGMRPRSSFSSSSSAAPARIRCWAARPARNGGRAPALGRKSVLGIRLPARNPRLPRRRRLRRGRLTPSSTSAPTSSGRQTAASPPASPGATSPPVPSSSMPTVDSPRPTRTPSARSSSTTWRGRWGAEERRNYQSNFPIHVPRNSVLFHLIPVFGVSERTAPDPGAQPSFAIIASDLSQYSSPLRPKLVVLVFVRNYYINNFPLRTSLAQ